MKRLLVSAALAPMLFSVAPVCADDGFSLFSDTKFNGEIRPRFESVSVEDSTKKDANAFTVRATLGMEAKLLGIDGLTIKLDGTTVQSIGGEHHNSSTNGHTNYEIVKDPETTRFSQSILQYKRGKTTAKVGRQIVNLDNERFVGSVDWRQMMQSFDAAVISDNTITNLALTGAYVWGIKGITNLPVTDTDSIILNGSYKVNEMVKVTAYDYILSSLHDTMGLALTGNIPVYTAKIDYRAEYASQNNASRDTSGGVVNAQADAVYYNLDALVNINGLLVGGGYEVLSGTSGSDGKTAFQTPLATLHKFNGWADKFLATPAGGLCDASATLGYTAPGLGKAMIVYHDFETDKAMAEKSDLGTEWDLLYTNAIPGIKGLSGLAKAAYYQGGDVAGNTKDVTKIWLQLGYKF